MKNISFAKLLGLVLLGQILVLVNCTSPDSQQGNQNRLADRQIVHRAGVEAPLPNAANRSHYIARADATTAADRQLLAQGLHAEFVTRNVARMGDQMALWPGASQYTHLVICIEQKRTGNTPKGAGGANASIQRIDLGSGKTETVLYGMHRCDGVRTTPWGTVIVNEETGDGRVYEILDPVNTTGHWVANRATGDIRDAIDSTVTSRQIAQRAALPTMAWEGFAVQGSGVVTGGDELGPGNMLSDNASGNNGGAIYKFIPDHPWTGNKKITGLDQSPLVSGKSFALVCTETTAAGIRPLARKCNGPARWVLIEEKNARQDARNKQATGFYRPEDMHRDPSYAGEGVRFCWTNTGKESAGIFGEVMCAIEHNSLPNNLVLQTDARTGFQYLTDASVIPAMQVGVFVSGNSRFNSFDNLAFQANTGNLFVVEDHQYGEVIACVPDGDDEDNKSDGCVSVLSVIDPDAEPTGLVFDASGQNAWYIIQHGEQPDALKDFASNPVDGETDDLIKITGFKP